MKLEEFQELKDKVGNAQIIVDKIDTVEYLITLLSNGVVRDALKTAICRKSVNSQKEKVAEILADIDIASVENEVVEQIVQKVRERRETLLSELDEY